MSARARHLRGARAVQAVLVSCVGLIVALLSASSAQANQAPWVIAFGNNVGLSDEVPLRYAERDALEVAAVLQRHGQVPASNAITLLGADLVAVKATFALTSERIRTSSPEGLVVVFYSGHADARGLHLGASILPFGELEALVSAIPARLRILIVDACRSGGVTRVKGIKRGEDFTIQSEDMLTARGLAVITSSAAGEDSYESDRLRASFFSHHLVTGLRGAADANGDQQVSLDELYRYAHDQTLKSSGQTRELQHPTFRFDVRGRGAVILTRVGDDTQGAAIVLPRPGTYLVLEEHANGPLTAEATATRPGARVMLPPRRYFIQERQTDHFLEYEVQLRAAERVDLAALPSRRVDYARLVRKGGERSLSHALRVLGGVGSGHLEGQGLSPLVALGYALELRELSLGLRLRLNPPTALGDPSPEGLVVEHTELGLGITAQRFFDARGVSFGVGLLVEGAWLAQRFSGGPVAEPGRDALAAGFGLLATVQVPLGAGLQLELEGGPMALFYPVTRLSQGAPRGDETRTRITWQVAGGIGWTF